MSEQEPSPESGAGPAAPGCRGLDALDVVGTLAAAEQALADRHAAEVLALEIDLHYAVLHSDRPAPPTGPLEGTTRLVRLGGDGTPKVQDLPICELAIARGQHVTSARRHLADALDLAHRLPRLWALLREGKGQVWVARKVVARSRHLTLKQVVAVDGAVAVAIDQAPGRLLTIAEAAILRADPDTAGRHAEQTRRARCLVIGQSDEDGLRKVFARIDAGDAAWLDAMVDRIATALTARPDLIPDLIAHQARIGALDLDRDLLRVEAFAWLAHPVAVLDLLRGTYPAAEATDDVTEPEPEPGAPSTGSETRQRAVVHVHLAAEAVTGLLGDHSVARVEELGPMLQEQVRRLLGHARVELKPVVDLNRHRSVNAYEHPADIRERGFLRSCGDVFPHAQSLSRHCDSDHPVPYQANGPPGQTGDRNHAPLGRHHHRAKTHLGYRVWQLGLSRYLWRTPHGLWRLVDETGTHLIDADTGRRLAAG